MIKLLLLATQICTMAAAEASYKSLNSSCLSCNKIDSAVNKHNSELSPDKKLELALDVARVIRKISLKGKPELDQKREIYFAINGSLQVLEDDFDSESVIRLMDLRTQSPKNFDYVFWRFPVAEQQKIAERMQAAKEDKLRPKAQVPPIKQID